MDFNFENVSAGRNKFVMMGINHDVTIVGVESGKSQTGKDYIQINTKLTGDSDDNTTKLKIWITDKARKSSMSKIMAIHSAVSKIAVLKDKNFKDVKTMAAGLNDLWSGKRLRLKLQGEEWIGEDADGNSKTKIRTSIPMWDFVEAIDSGAEMYPIADANTQLKFDKENKWDYKRLEEDDSEAISPEKPKTEDPDNDLPF